MTLTTKIALALLAIALIWIGAASSQSPANCWDQYQTEDEAIMHCENHSGN